MSLPHYYLEKPDLKKVDAAKVMEKLSLSSDKLQELFTRVNSPYLYWDSLRYKISPSAGSFPYGVTPEEGWFLIRQLRKLSSQKTVIKSEKGSYFSWIRLPYNDEFLQRLDMHAGASIFPNGFSSSDRNQFVIRGIMEEAIASSQLEGAHTTRTVAKKMLLENRLPQNKSEQMIVNNYKTIVAIENQYKDSELSLDLMFTLHSQLLENTDFPDEQKRRLREDRDNIVVSGFISSQEYITHVPPGESFLQEEINNLIDFANDNESDRFVHPIIKAIFLHFWIGYLHPFTDGNGRLARALFYWYLLKKGYWMIAYLPISVIIKRAEVQYPMAYIYSEQDGFDLTYFYDFHIRKLIQALEEFQIYIQSKLGENKKLDTVLGQDMKLNLNDRQKQLLHYLLGDDHASVTVTSHGDIHKISRQTAAKDLKSLEDNGLLTPKREGKFIRFYPTEKLLQLHKKV